MRLWQSASTYASLNAKRKCKYEEAVRRDRAIIRRKIFMPEAKRRHVLRSRPYPCLLRTWSTTTRACQPERSRQDR